MYTSINANNNSTNFKAGYHMYFYTDKGERIITDKNMKKCLHYVEAHLNGSKRVKVRNQELIDTMKFGQRGKDGERIGGDADYRACPIIRSVIDKTAGKVQGFINVVTGRDVDVIAKRYGEDMGRNKHISLVRTGSTKSFETSHSVNRYIEKAPDYAESRGVYKNGERQAFGVMFKPILNKKGEVKSFEYVRAGFFDESKIK